MQSPSDFQRTVFNVLAILGLSQTHIVRERNGAYTLKTGSLARRLLYVFLRVNTGLKFAFLVLLSCGVFQAEFEFFEKMAIALWFLIMILLGTSERLWYRTYPFFEILTAWWRIEERLYDKLGRPNQFVKDIRSISVSRVWFHGIVALVGILAVAVQYDAAPKYCVFAFSIIQSEDPILKWLFGAHEILFLTHAWLVYGSGIYVSSALGAEFTFNVEALQEVMDTFVQNMHIKRSLGPHGSKVSASTKRKRFSRGSSILSDNQLVIEVRSIGLQNRLRDVMYTPVSLVKEYKNINCLVTQLNNFAGYNFLYIHACSYIQMISDVYQLVEILRTPEASFIDAVFFAEDMSMCMYLLYRTFKSMAFLHPSSESFLESLRSLLAMPPSSMSRFDRLMLIKEKPTLRPTCFRIGPCRMKVGFVGQAMDVLLQYYVTILLM